MTANAKFTKELVAELNAEVDKELSIGRLFSSYAEALNFAKLNSGVVIRNPKHENEWIVKLPIKKETSPKFKQIPSKPRKTLAAIPTSPPGRETAPIAHQRQSPIDLSPQKTPKVIYKNDEAHLLSERECNVCGTLIPQLRIDLQPNVTRCVTCQAQYETVVDTSRKVDEGFGGSREDIRKMKAKQWGEMVNRENVTKYRKPKRTK
jgi:5-methylcytosine-specific restriction endonuclease McrA